MRHYTVAFLRSHIGQKLLRRDRAARSSHHIIVGHVEAQEIRWRTTW